MLLFHLVREIKPGALVVYPSKRDQQIPLGPFGRKKSYSVGTRCQEQKKAVSNHSCRSMAYHAHNSIKMRRLSATLRNVAAETLPQVRGPRRSLAMERSASHKI